MSLLAVRGLTKAFSGLKAIQELELEIKTGTIHAIIGPNGAGKTTLFNAITGLVPASTGEIYFEGNLLNGKRSDEIARLGIARTFQNIRLFSDLSVYMNVQIGRHVRNRAGLAAALFRPAWVTAEEAASHAEVSALLARLHLEAVAKEKVSNLSYGDQRRVEIARALAAHPKLLLLDEPMVGMNYDESSALMTLIQEVRQEGVTVALIGHHMPFIMALADVITVLNVGRKIAEGTPEAISQDPVVVDAYLGSP